jgi:hypothetical protein
MSIQLTMIVIELYLINHLNHVFLSIFIINSLPAFPLVVLVLAVATFRVPLVPFELVLHRLQPSTVVESISSFDLNYKLDKS